MQESDLFTTPVTSGRVIEESFLLYDTSCSASNCAINDADSVTRPYCIFVCSRTLLLYGQGEGVTVSFSEITTASGPFRSPRNACESVPYGTEDSASLRATRALICVFLPRGAVSPDVARNTQGPPRVCP